MFEISKNTPPGRAIAASDPAVLLHCSHKRLVMPRPHAVTHCHQRGPVFERRCSLLNDRWHPPMAPRRGVRCRIRQLPEGANRDRCDRAQTRHHQRGRNSGPCRDKTPHGAARRQASLKDQYEYREDARSRPIRRQHRHRLGPFMSWVVATRSIVEQVADHCRQRFICSPSDLPKRPERLSKIVGDGLWLLPGGEVPALGVLVVAEELGICPLRPTSRCGVDLV